MTDDLPVPTRRPWPVGALLCVLAVVVAGCSSSAAIDDRPDDGPLVATATASTLFDTQRAFRLELAGTGGDVVVRSLELASPWYVPVDPVARSLRLGDGSERLVPLPYGEAVCDHGSPGPGESIGEVVATTDDGVVRVDLGVHPDDLVAGRHRRECAVAATRAAVDLDFGEAWTVEGPRTATGSLVVAPRGDATVRVDGVEGNIVFTAEAVDDLPGTFDGRVREVPIRVTAARCDTHALIEAKNKTQYPVEVVVDDGEPVRVVVEASGATAATLQGLLENCLATTGDPDQ